MLRQRYISSDRNYAATTMQGGKKIPLIWINLNDFDNDPKHFWRTLLTDLSTWDMNFAHSGFQQDFPRSNNQIEAFLNRFGKAITAHPIKIVFYNIQAITSPTIKEFLDELHSIKRNDFSVAFIYGRNEVYFETKDKDSNNYDTHWYMSIKEEQQFYLEHGIELSDKRFEEVRYFTDGWRAAVELLVELITKNDISILGNLEFYVRTWLETVFFPSYSQSDMLQLVLLSLLDDFSLGLIRDLSGWSGDSLVAIMRESPIVRYDESTRRFFYSNYFFPIIKEHQVLVNNASKKEFYERVGDCYRDHGEKIKAVTNYHKAGKNKKILEEMNRWSFPNSRELANCYIATINEMPASFIKKNPIIEVILAHMLCTLSRYKDAGMMMENFCSLHDKEEVVDADISPVLGEAYLLWAYVECCLLSDEEKLQTLFKRAAELLPNGSFMIDNKLNIFSDRPVIQLLSTKAGALEKHVQNLATIEPYLFQATRGGWAGCSALADAELNYYTRNFKNVEIPAHKAIAIALENNQYDVACSACYLLMRFNLAKGNYERTMESLRMLQQYASEADYDTFFSMPDLAESWLQLKLGNKHKVSDWIRDEQRHRQIIMPWNYGRDRLIRAYYLLLNQQYDSVISFTQTNIDLFDKRGYGLLSLNLILLQAVAYHELNEKEKSVMLMQVYYERSHGNNIVMPIVEYGNRVRPLVENCYESKTCSIPKQWLDEILRRANSYYVYQYNIRKQHEKKQHDKTSLLENLTTAEQRTLLMICQGTTAREIAELDDRGLSTVKGMIRRIYAKIGAHGKADAVRIATECNIEEAAQF